jgi:hypothetical protein
MSRNRKPPQDGYEVGYGKPPVHTRFRKGQSGNPTGGRRNTEIERAKKLLQEEAYRRITVREGEKVIRMPILQAVLRNQLALAAKGSVPAQRAVSRNIQEIEAEICAGKNPAMNRGRRGVDLECLTDQELIEICRAGRKA